VADADVADAGVRDAEVRDAEVRDAEVRDAEVRDAEFGDADVADVAGAGERDAAVAGAEGRGAAIVDDREAGVVDGVPVDETGLRPDDAVVAAGASTKSTKRRVNGARLGAVPNTEGTDATSDAR
jgi:hypothetical protein